MTAWAGPDPLGATLERRPKKQLHAYRGSIHLPEQVICCSRCYKTFEAPRSAGTLDVECRWCGNRMHIVTLEPAGEKGQAR